MEKQILTTTSLVTLKAIASVEILEQEISQRLKTNIVHFVYEKSGGELREAFGTQNRDLIPNIKLTEGVVRELSNATDNLISNMEKVIENPELLKADPEAFEYGIEILKGIRNQAFGNPETVGKARPENEEYINYYDFESKGFRKFKKVNLRAIL